jgi:hypothetical protein
MRRERRWGVGGGRRDRGTRREERTGASARQERKERWVGVARPNGRLISCTAMIKEMGESCAAGMGVGRACRHLASSFTESRGRGEKIGEGGGEVCGPCGRGTRTKAGDGEGGLGRKKVAESGSRR